MFVSPTLAHLVGSQRLVAPAHPHRPRRGGARRGRRLTGVVAGLALLLLAASAAFGTPLSHASVSASEQSMDFGTQDIGTIGPARGVLITNEGPDGVLLDSLEFTGPDAGDFQVETEDCTEEVLPARSRCVIGLRFSPSRTGDLSAALQVSSTERSSESVSVWLSGIGAGPPPPPVTLTVEKVGDGFGSVSVDGTEMTCEEVCTASVESGDTVALTATAAVGSEFVGWYGGGCGIAATCETLVEVDTTIHAFFGQVTNPPEIKPPHATSKPSVRGNRRVGARLRCSTGEWSGTGPLAFAYRWTSGGRQVPGARGQVYRVRRADRGRRIACRVIARGPGGAISATSLPVRIRRARLG